MGLKWGAIGSTLEEHIGNVENILKTCCEQRKNEKNSPPLATQNLKEKNQGTLNACWSNIFVDQSAKLGYLFKLQSSVGGGFIWFLTYQLHKGKYKISKKVHLSTTVTYTCAHLVLQAIYLKVEPMAKQYGITNDVLLGTS